MPNTHRLLLVEPDPLDAVPVRDVLLSSGHSVQVVPTFEEAVTALAQGRTTLLITALRLGRFNGLHLVIRSRVLHPDVPALVLADSSDNSSDIDRLGVRLVSKPVDTQALAATVADLLAQREIPPTALPRRWPRKHAHLPAQISNAEAEVIDLSYGGLRIEGPVPAPGGTPVVVNFPTLGLSVTGVARWTKPLGEGAASWCGVEILEGGADTTAAWRGVVDSIH